LVFCFFGEGIWVSQNKNFAVLLGLVLVLAPKLALAQSEDAPLGDVARSAREDKFKAKPAKVSLDNESFAQYLDDAENKHQTGTTLRFFLGPEPALQSFQQLNSPDFTCNLSFSAQPANPAESLKPKTETLPSAELSKLEGPATIAGDSLQVSIYNGSNWKVEEITVGLTIVRKPKTVAALVGSAQLMPASATQTMVKNSDTTLLYHLKGSAAPSATAVFQDALGITLAPEEEWHWAVLSAKGVAVPDQKQQQ
jgi:hypothetical protein